MKPNLFLAGAPKSGTTSLAQYLDDRDDVFVCTPKEPHFWTPEYDNTQNGVGDLLAYESLFSNASDQHRVRCDASTSTLWSESALEQTLNYAPHARYIVIVRNPIEVADALHMQLVFSANEDVREFETAWRLQYQRAQGVRIPTGAYCPAELQYGHVARLGQQVQRFFELVPADQRLVILFDDLKVSVQSVYETVLSFLELPQDGRTEFEVHNAAKTARWAKLSQLVRHPPGPLKPIADGARRLAWACGLRGLRFKLRSTLLAKKQTRAPLTAEFRAELADEFRSDVTLLGELLDRDLSAWLDMTGSSVLPEAEPSRSVTSPT